MLWPRFSSAIGYNWHIAEYQFTHIKYSKNLYIVFLKRFLHIQKSPNTTNAILVGIAALPVQPLYVILATPLRKPRTTRYISVICCLVVSYVKSNRYYCQANHCYALDTFISYWLHDKPPVAALCAALQHVLLGDVSACAQAT